MPGNMNVNLRNIFAVTTNMTRLRTNESRDKDI